MWFHYVLYHPPHPRSLLLSLSLFSSKESCDPSGVECETVSLDDSKKFKIININQTNLEPQLIEIDKLLINNGANGPKQNASSSRVGVWHQVSWYFAFFVFPPARNFHCFSFVRGAVCEWRHEKFHFKYAKAFAAMFGSFATLIM